MKKINYKVADVILLIIIFLAFKIFEKYIFGILKSNKDTIFIALGVSLIFFSIYINRFFFRLSHKEIIHLSQKGWKITGYYSKLSLSNEDIYNKSYNIWIKYSCIFLLIELFGLLIVYVLNKCFLTNNMFFVHIVIAFISQIIAWIITMIREKNILNNKKKFRKCDQK